MYCFKWCYDVDKAFEYIIAIEKSIQADFYTRLNMVLIRIINN